MANPAQDDKDPEEFIFGDSLVVDLMQLLDDVNNSTQREESTKKVDKEKKGFSPPKIDEENFIVCKGLEDRRYTDESKKPKKSSSKSTLFESTIELNPPILPFDQFTFGNQIDCNPELRAKVRAERERIANNFRALGNGEYRRFKYKEAIYFYEKGLMAVNDTPVLYCSRGLCRAKLGKYEHALLDFDLVISKLNAGCLQAWLYRAACHQRLGNDAKFRESITMAQHHNPGKSAYIEEFLVKLKSGNF